jgi:hypothetical protein
MIAHLAEHDGALEWLARGMPIGAPHLVDIYVRASRASQSTANQTLDLTQFCAAAGLRIRFIYSEGVQSSHTSGAAAVPVLYQLAMDSLAAAHQPPISQPPPKSMRVRKGGGKEIITPGFDSAVVPLVVWTLSRLGRRCHSDRISLWAREDWRPRIRARRPVCVS